MPSLSRGDGSTVPKPRADAASGVPIISIEDGSTNVEIDEKKLLRKIDMRVIPILLLVGIQPIGG